MKKSLFNNLLWMVIGILICGCGYVIAASFAASDIKYSPKDKNWKVKNVAEAINSLKESVHNSSISPSVYKKMLNNINGALNMEDGLVPILTSNEGPNGHAFCSAESNLGPEYAAYKAFNGDLSGDDKQNWSSRVLAGNYGYIGYEFNEPVEADTFYVNTLKTDNYTQVSMFEFVLQGSNDGETWVDLCDNIYQEPKTIGYYGITKNQGKYKSYRLYGKSAGGVSNVSIHELQLFYLFN